MLNSHFFKDRSEIMFVFTAAICSKVLDLQLSFCFDLFD